MDQELNYFNYFTEIERFYQSKRETFTLLSTLDWVLIENWKEQGIPLETRAERHRPRILAREAKDQFARVLRKGRRRSLRGTKGTLTIEAPALPDFDGNEVASTCRSSLTRLNL